MTHKKWGPASYNSTGEETISSKKKPGSGFSQAARRGTQTRRDNGKRIHTTSKNQIPDSNAPKTFLLPQVVKFNLQSDEWARIVWEDREPRDKQRRSENRLKR